MKLRILAIILLLAFPELVSAQYPGSKAKIDSLLTILEANNKLMGQLAISKGGEIVYNRSIGFSSMIDNTMVRPDAGTGYRIGSVSKMFTSVMIFQLIEEGKLTLQTRLSSFFPDLPNASQITIGHLLTHQSGLHNFTDDSTYMLIYQNPQSRQQMLDLFKQQKTDFAPGTKADYSNTNYIILGYIIEHLTGTSYADAVKKRITDRIGLRNTYQGGDRNKTEAFSYSYSGKTWIKEPDTHMSIPLGAGGIISNASDLTTFINALFTHRLISRASLDTMKKIRNSYGYGIFRIPFASRSSFGHSGSIDGFESFLAYFPDDSVAIAFTGNGSNYRLNDMLLGALSIFYGKDYQLPGFGLYKLAPEQLKGYAGVYASPEFPLKITISDNGDHLTAQATGQSAFPLEPVSISQFRFDPAGIVIDFTIVDGKPVGKFVLKQGGRNTNFERQ